MEENKKFTLKRQLEIEEEAKINNNRSQLQSTSGVGLLKDQSHKSALNDFEFSTNNLISGGENNFEKVKEQIENNKNISIIDNNSKTIDIKSMELDRIKFKKLTPKENTNV